MCEGEGGGVLQRSDRYPFAPYGEYPHSTEQIESHVKHDQCCMVQSTPLRIQVSSDTVQLVMPHLLIMQHPKHLNRAVLMALTGLPVIRSRATRDKETSWKYSDQIKVRNITYRLPTWQQQWHLHKSHTPNGLNHVHNMANTFCNWPCEVLYRNEQQICGIHLALYDETISTELGFHSKIPSDISHITCGIGHMLTSAAQLHFSA